MKPHVLVDSHDIADVGKVALYEHDGDYEIRVDGLVLMSTRASHSEEELAAKGCSGLPTQPAHVLIGGLGFGFTLVEVLKYAKPATKITVAELLRCVIDWNQDAALGLAAKAIADERVELIEIDVGKCMRDNPGEFDVILLDVDNGPSAFTKAGNSSLYTDQGLTVIRKALRDRGVFALWSATPDPGFLTRMERAGFKAECIRSRARAGKGSPHFIYSGSKA